jgi:hypothetical protein
MNNNYNNYFLNLYNGKTLHQKEDLIPNFSRISSNNVETFADITKVPKNDTSNDTQEDIIESGQGLLTTLMNSNSVEKFTDNNNTQKNETTNNTEEEPDIIKKGRGLLTTLMNSTKN